MNLQELGKNAVKAKFILQSLSTAEKNRALSAAADLPPDIWTEN